jgi:hypothetical protein
MYMQLFLYVLSSFLRFLLELFTGGFHVARALQVATLKLYPTRRLLCRVEGKLDPEFSEFVLLVLVRKNTAGATATGHLRKKSRSPVLRSLVSNLALPLSSAAGLGHGKVTGHHE